MKQAIYFAGACAGIVLWHLPTTAACFARTVEGSYTSSEGGALAAPMHSGQVEVAPAVFSVENVFETPTPSIGVFEAEEPFGPLAWPYAFASHEPLVEPR